MAPSATALALCMALLLARRTDGESLLPTPRWSSAPRLLGLSPRAPGRLLCRPPHPRSRRRAGDRDGEGTQGRWRAELQLGHLCWLLSTQAGRARRLLPAWSRTRPGLPACHSPFFAVLEPKGCVSPQASALLISASVDHSALYCGEMPWSLAWCSADSHPPWAAVRLSVCQQTAAAEETSTERLKPAQKG